MTSFYPVGVGVDIIPSEISVEHTKVFISTVPEDLTLHIYGMTNTGRQSLAIRLAELLGAYLVIEDLVLLGIAYAITQNPTHYDMHNFEEYFGDLYFTSSGSGIMPVINGKRVTLKELYTPKTMILSQKLLIDQKYLNHHSAYCLGALNELSGNRVIVVGWSAMPDFLERYLKPESTCEHILLTCEEEIRYTRWLAHTPIYPSFSEESAVDKSTKSSLDYAKYVSTFDEITISHSLSSGTGVVSNESLVIDTTNIPSDTVLKSLLRYWWEVV